MARRRRQPRREVQWDFFSFPVAFAFACGALLATLLIGAGLFTIVWVLSLFGTSFGVAHIFSHWIRRRTQERRRAREEEAERERRALAGREAAAAEGPPRRRRRRRT